MFCMVMSKVENIHDGTASLEFKYLKLLHRVYMSAIIVYL